MGLGTSHPRGKPGSGLHGNHSRAWQSAHISQSCRRCPMYEFWVNGWHYWLNVERCCINYTCRMSTVELAFATVALGTLCSTAATYVSSSGCLASSLLSVIVGCSRIIAAATHATEATAKGHIERRVNITQNAFDPPWLPFSYRYCCFFGAVTISLSRDIIMS